MNWKTNKIILSIKGRLHTISLSIGRIFNSIYVTIYSDGNNIILNSWINYKFGKLEPNNWGDDLNVFLVEALTKKKTIGRYNIWGKKNHTNYTVIGSVVDIWSNPNTIIWGGGAMYGGNYSMKYKPLKVCAVRGKLTRDYLLSNDIQCPSVYGDPALLLPMIYAPTIKKKYKIGIIPHKSEQNNKIYTQLREHNPEDVIVIDLMRYSKWTDIIDQIVSCDLILSSSLHGLIVSDAYNVPNVWIESSVALHGGYFKFLDYFSGVGRKTETPIVLTDEYTINDLLLLSDEYQSITFDRDSLINSCPFEIKI